MTSFKFSEDRATKLLLGLVAALYLVCIAGLVINL
jgi:hypothetical protein